MFKKTKIFKITSCFGEDPEEWIILIGDLFKVYPFEISSLSSWVRSMVAELLTTTLFREFMGTAGGTAFLSTKGDNVYTFDGDCTC